jgi:hypothetical protein
VTKAIVRLSGIGSRLTAQCVGIGGDGGRAADRVIAVVLGAAWTAVTGPDRKLATTAAAATTTAVTAAVAA